MVSKGHSVSLIIFICLLLGSGVGTMGMGIDLNFRSYFSHENAVYKIDQVVRNFFPEDSVFVFLFEGEDVLGNVFLEKFNTDVQKIQSLNNVRRVLSIVSADQILQTDDGFMTAPLFDMKTDSALSIEARKNKILQDRYARDAYISRDGHSLAIIVRPDATTSTLDQEKLRKEIMQIFDGSTLSKKLVAISGPLEVDYYQYQAMLDNLKIFIPLTILINLVLLWWMFPRPLIILLSLSTIGILSSFPTALLSQFHMNFTMIHTMVTPLMSALSVALIIHYLNRIRYYAGLGIASNERAYRARNDILKPALFTTLTTIAGLGSLAFSSIPPIQSFGIITAASSALLFIIVMFLLPPMIARWDSEKPWKQGRVIDVILNKLTQLCAHFAIRRAGWILGSVVVLFFASIPAISNVQVETDVFTFFDQKHPINTNAQKVEATLMGVTTLDISLQALSFDDLKDPEIIRQIHSLQKWLAALPEVDRAVSYIDVIEDMNRAFHGGKEEDRRIPDDADLISQYLFIYGGEDLYEYVNYDFDHARIAMNLNIHRASEIRKLIQKIESRVDELSMNGVQIHVIGLGALFSELSDQVVKTQLLSMLTALGVIFAFMMVIFRSVGSGCLCMIPNVAPVLTVFALMGLFSIWLDIGTAMIASIGVGIAVDDTIHLYHVYIKKRREGCGIVLSLMRGYQHSGRAVVATTVILAAQFLIISFSDFVPSSNFGLLSAISIVSALLFDLLVLPAVIVVVSKLGERSSST